MTTRLSRRSFLRGAGVSIALPMLEAMTPHRLSSQPLESGAADRELPPRVACCYIPNGVNIARWTPQGDGQSFPLSPTLEPLASLRQHVTVLTGLGHLRSDGGHFGADEFLTGADLDATPDRGYSNTVSVDQVAARTVGLQTRIPSLELSSNGGTGSAGHSHTLSFDDNGTPIPAECNPRRVFQRLFQNDDTTSRQRKLQNIEEDLSILDSVLQDASSLTRKLGRNDRRKLDEYLTSVREVERRVKQKESWLDVPRPRVDSGDLSLDASPDASHSRSRYFQTMFDLMFLAFQTDTTRVATFAMGREAGGGQYDEIGVPDVQHSLSHHGGDPEMLDRLAKIDHFLVEQFAYFIGRLGGTTDGDGTLLDRTMVLFGSGMNNGDRGVHSPKNLPLLFAGGEKLGLRQGQHLRFKIDSTPFSNVHRTILDRMGIRDIEFSDSTHVVTEMYD